MRKILPFWIPPIISTSKHGAVVAFTHVYLAISSRPRKSPWVHSVNHGPAAKTMHPFRTTALCEINIYSIGLISSGILPGIRTQWALRDTLTHLLRILWSRKKTEITIKLSKPPESTVVTCYGPYMTYKGFHEIRCNGKSVLYTLKFP